MSANGIVDVNITRETQTVSAKGFGTPIIFGNSPSNTADAAFPLDSAGALKFRTYEDTNGVLVDFPITSKEYLNAAKLFASDIKPDEIKIARVDTGAGTPETYPEAITAVSNVDDDFYLVLIIDRAVATQDAVSAHIESFGSPKLFMTSSNDDDIIDQTNVTDTTSIGALAFASNRDRTAIIHHDMGDISGATMPSDPCIDADWAGNRLPSDPGSSTWALKTLNSPTVSLTPAQRNNAHSKNVNTYEKRGGKGITFDGTVSSGEYIDIIRGIDWLTARICEAVYAKLTSVEKIPFTDEGIAIIESEIRAVLEEAEGVGLLTNNPKYVVTVPLARNVSTADKANRCLPDVKFTATLAGAIHKVTVNGVVSL